MIDKYSKSFSKLHYGEDSDEDKENQEIVGHMDSMIRDHGFTLNPNESCNYIKSKKDSHSNDSNISISLTLPSSNLDHLHENVLFTNYKDHVSKLTNLDPLMGKSNATIDSFQASKILLLTLLEKFCAFYDDKNDKGRKLFHSLCHRLTILGVLDKKDLLINPQYFSFYAESFKRLLLDSLKSQEIHESNTLSHEVIENECQRFIESPIHTPPNTIESPSHQRVDSMFGDSFIKTSSRYREDFNEICMIGRGAYGYVFKAKNKLDGIEYGIKKVSMQEIISPDVFLREVKSLARLDHINIVRYHSAWLELSKEIELDKGKAEDEKYTSVDRLDSLSGESFTDTIINHDSSEFDNQSRYLHFNLYIQMQLCQGTLKDWIKYRNQLIFNLPMNESTRLGDINKTMDQMVINDPNTNPHDNKKIIHAKENMKLFRQVVEGLDYIHSQNLMHRDLKPQNILFYHHDDHSLIPKIGDFGLVAKNKFRSSDPTTGDNQLYMDRKYNLSDDDDEDEKSHTSGVGTVTYSPPEQLLQTDYNEKVDIYSLGIILFELYQPFYSGMERVDVLNQLKDLHVLPSEFVQKWPDIAELVLKCMEKDPNLRPSTKDILSLSIIHAYGFEGMVNELESQLSQKDKEIQKLKEIIMRQKELLQEGIIVHTAN